MMWTSQMLFETAAIAFVAGVITGMGIVTFLYL